MKHENCENSETRIEKIEKTSCELALLGPKVSADEFYRHCKDLHRKLDLRSHGALSDVTDLRISCELWISCGGRFSEQFWQIEM